MANEILYKPSEMPPAIHELGEQLNSAKYGFEKIEEAIEYSKDGVQYESDLTKAKNTIIEDDAYFEDIGEAIVNKDGGEIPEKSEMAERIENISSDYELILDITLNESVSEIAINLEIEKYTEFIFVPELRCGISSEQIYFSFVDLSGEVKSNNQWYSSQIYDYISYSRNGLLYYLSFSPNKTALFRDSVSCRAFPISETYKKVIFTFYNSSSLFLSGGTYKLFGRKSVIDVN